MPPSLPRLALTPGEPAGIGPDLCLRLSRQSVAAELVVFADPDLLRQRATQLGLPAHIELFDPNAPPAVSPPGVLRVWPLSLAAPVEAGRLDPANAGYVLDSLRQAVHACEQRRFDALVTGPVHKGVINDAGQPFTGHTEFLAELTGAEPVMMLATPGLRVALATTHLPLAAVTPAITRSRLEGVLTILHRDLVRRFGIAQPHILVCGLNPHAGEGGHLGREEIEIIEPVLQMLRHQHGMTLEGPLPADTLFTPKYLDRADAVLAMYHDQGLPVLKYRGFGQAVNITLGLPIIRTSVDHGTALELAGTGQASAASLEAALAMALHMAGCVQA